MQNDVRVSVIIPVYNSGKYLSECLESVRKQTLKKIEIICVDDGSTDDSLTILKNYSRKDHRIKVIAQKNAGVSVARNTGIKNARGEYINFLDSDDYLDYKALKRVYKEASRNNADIVVFGGSTFPNSTWANNNLDTKKNFYQGNAMEALFQEKGSKPWCVNKLYKRSLISGNNILFNEELSLGEDLAFIFEVFPLANIICFIPDKFYYYRQHIGSAMANYNINLDIKVRNHLKILQYIIQIWEENGYLVKYGKNLVEWMMDFILDDVKKCRYNFKMETYRKIIGIIEKLVNTSKLDERHKHQYDEVRTQVETVFHPRVSVIMPIYNAADYLRETLQCLSEQTFLDFEMIFVDDGSTDKSLEIINEFTKDDHRARVIIQQHGFAGVARNNGMKYANGDYLLFLDSDDFFSPDMIRKVVEKADQTDSDICVFPADCYDQQTKQKSPMPWTCRNVYFKDNTDSFSRHTYPKYIYCFTTPAPWNKLFRKTFVINNDLLFQDTRSANDMAFVMTALAVAEKITIVNDVLLTYRVNNVNSLQGSQDKKSDAFYEALLELRRRLKEKEVYKSIEPAFINFALDFCIYNLKSMPTPQSFEDVYFLLKHKAFEELDLLRWPEDWFYAYKPNKIFENRQDIKTLSLIEYVNKYSISFDRNNNEFKRSENMILQKTYSFNDGREISWVSKTLRGGFQCLRDNGFKYTVHRIGEKVKERIRNGQSI